MTDERLDLRTSPGSDLAHHRAAPADEDLFLRRRLDVERHADEPLLELLDLGGDRMRHLVTGQLDRFLADELGNLLLDGQVGALLEREVLRPLRQEPHQLRAKLVHAVPRLRAHRVERVEVAETRRGRHLRCDVARLQPVDLVQGDHDRNARREDPIGDEAVAGTDAVTRVEHEEHCIDLLEGRVDGALHVLCQGVARALEAGQIRQHQLVVVAVRDAEDSPAGGLRLVGRDCHLRACEGVHERRLAHVRPSRDGDEAGSQDSSSNVSGRSSSGVATAPSPAARR